MSRDRSQAFSNFNDHQQNECSAQKAPGNFGPSGPIDNKTRVKWPQLAAANTLYAKMR